MCRSGSSHILTDGYTGGAEGEGRFASFGYKFRITVLRELWIIVFLDKPWVSSLGGPSVTLPRRVEHNDRTTIVETCRFALNPHGLRPCVAHPPRLTHSSTGCAFACAVA